MGDLTQSVERQNLSLPKEEETLPVGSGLSPCPKGSSLLAWPARPPALSAHSPCACVRVYTYVHACTLTRIYVYVYLLLVLFLWYNLD